MDLKTKLLRFTGPLDPFYYNYFFNPNICHICKSANEGTLELCSCCMISYCNIVHKIMHQAEHRQICIIIKYLLRERPYYYTRQLTSTEWHKSKENLKELINKTILRPLQYCEIQMLMFAKSCLICHQQTGLRACNICFSANFCSDHSIDFHQFHSSSCKEQLIFLNYNIALINGELPRKLQKFCVFPDKLRCPSNTLEFIGLYLHPRNKLWAVKPWTTDHMSLADYYYSDYVSDPLTLYYGMQEASLIDFLSKPVCVIHIYSMTGHVLGPLGYRAWEILLHLLHNKVQKMIIIFRTPIINITSSTIDICARCRLNKQVLIFEYYPMLYQNYIFSSVYRYPNVIVGLQPESYDVTLDCLETLQNQDCPVFFTTISRYRAEQLATNINDVLNTTAQPLLIAKNRFAGLTPRKNLTSIEDIYYRNDHLVVYKNLRSSNESTPEHSKSLS